MSKRSEEASAPAAPTRLQVSRYEREQKQRRFIVLGSIAVGILTLALVIAAAVQIGVVEPSRAVGSVAGQSITVQNLQKRMRLTQNSVIGNASQLRQQIVQASGSEQGQFLVQFYQQQYQQVVSQGSAEAIAQSAYQSMVDDLLVRQETAKRGLTAAPEDVQAELEKSIGLYRATLTPFPTQPPEPTFVVSGTAIAPPTQEPRLQPTTITEDTFKYELAKRVSGLTDFGYSEADLRNFVENDLLTRKLQEDIGKTTPIESPHYTFDFVRFNVITDAVAAADQLARKQIGFEALISRTNAITLPTTIGSGQNVTWTSEAQVRELYGPEVLDQLSFKSIGASTGVITSSTSSGVYVLMPRGRETRKVDENELARAKRDAYEAWLNKARLDTSLVKKDIDPATIIPPVVRNTATDFAQQNALPQ
jgi:hypothetical protein